MSASRARRGQLAAIESRLTAAATTALSAWAAAVRTRLRAESVAGLRPDTALAVRLAPTWASLVDTHLAPVLRAVIEEVLVAEGGQAALDRPWLDNHLAGLAARCAGIPTFTAKRLATELGASQTTATSVLLHRSTETLVGAAADRMWATRAEFLAAREAVAALNGALLAAWSTRPTPPAGKTWDTAGDDRVRPCHAALAGRVLPLGAHFQIGSASLAHPGDPAGGIAQTAYCRCLLVEADALPTPGLIAAPGNQTAAVLAAGGNDMSARTWSGLLAPFGVNSGDQRRLAANGTFSHRDLPLPLMFQKETGGGHDDSVVVGRILTCDIRMNPDGDNPAGFYGTGDYLVGEEFAEDVNRAIALTEAGLGHVSVDLCDVVVELVDAETGEPISEEDYILAWLEGKELNLVNQFREAGLMGVTQVAKPAFAEAHINLDAAEGNGGAPGTTIIADAGDPDSDGSHKLTDRSGKPIGVGDAVTVIDPDGDGDDDTQAGDDDGDGGTAFAGTVSSVDAGNNTVTVQPDDGGESWVGEAASVRITADADDEDAGNAGDDPDDSEGPAEYAADDVTLGAEQVASLQAAAGPVNDWRPDAEMFADPTLHQLTPMTIGPKDADGYRRVYGHLAGWQTCHIGFSNVCVTPPKEDSFAYFHVGEVELADGALLPVGNLTLGGRHADPKVAYRAAVEHYDDSGAGVAVVRAYKDEFGIAISGVLTPGTTDTQIVELRRSVLSGDWRRVGGAMRLVGGLAVNTGGFPVPRTEYAFDSTGRQISLVAAGLVPQGVKVEESYEDVARRVFAEEKQKEARRAEVAELTSGLPTLADELESLFDELAAEGVEL